MGFPQQGAKPTGFTGRIVGRLMNLVHAGLYIDFLQNFLHENDTVLDVGCGGGKLLNHLYRRSDSVSLIGLDHSKEMIKLAGDINRKGIKSGRIKLIHSSVYDIPLEDNSVNIVTAFETVQFWTDTEKAFREVSRVLNDGGKFIIVNRYPPKGSPWWIMAKLKSDEDYRTVLKNSGFKKISIDLSKKKGWIFIKAS